MAAMFIDCCGVREKDSLSTSPKTQVLTADPAAEMEKAPDSPHEATPEAAPEEGEQNPPEEEPSDARPNMYDGPSEKIKVRCGSTLPHISPQYCLGFIHDPPN